MTRSFGESALFVRSHLSASVPRRSWISSVIRLRSINFTFVSDCLSLRFPRTACVELSSVDSSTPSFSKLLSASAELSKAVSMTDRFASISTRSIPQSFAFLLRASSTDGEEDKSPISEEGCLETIQAAYSSRLPEMFRQWSTSISMRFLTDSERSSLAEILASTSLN